MSELEALLVGTALGLATSYLGVIWSRRSHASQKIFDKRMSTIEDIWSKLLNVQSSFAQIGGLGFSNWKISEYENALELLNVFRASIDTNKIILPQDVVEILKSIDQYFYLLMHEDDVRPGTHYSEVNGLLARLSTSVNAMFRINTHKIDLNLDNREKP